MAKFLEHEMSTSTTTTNQRRLPFFIAGVVLFFLGPVINAVQVSMKHFTTPWYLPILGTIGVLLMGVSVVQRPGVVRAILLGLFLLLGGGEWFLVLVGTRTPDYNGPAQPGRTVPAFAATFADGKPFTSKDLENGLPTVMVFFRGRW